MFSNDELNAMIQQKVISEQYPYSEKNDEVLLNYLKPLLAEMKRANIHYIVESDHFGSGYASYIKVLCYKDEFVETTDNIYGYTKNIKGLQVLVGRLAPVIVIGGASENTDYAPTGKVLSGSSQMLDGPRDLLIEPQFEPLYNTLVRLFMKYHFTLLQKEELEGPFSYEGHIPTLSREQGRYLVWDAIFYWED